MKFYLKMAYKEVDVVVTGRRPNTMISHIPGHSSQQRAHLPPEVLGSWSSSSEQESVITNVDHRSERPAVSSTFAEEYHSVEDHHLVEEVASGPSSVANLLLSFDSLDVSGLPPLPPECHCPITTEVFEDPVVACDGFTYERNVIESWLKTHNRSPMTGEVMDMRLLFPNKVVLQLIRRLE